MGAPERGGRRRRMGAARRWRAGVGKRKRAELAENGTGGTLLQGSVFPSKGQAGRPVTQKRKGGTRFFRSRVPLQRTGLKVVGCLSRRHSCRALLPPGSN